MSQDTSKARDDFPAAMPVSVGSHRPAERPPPAAGLAAAAAGVLLAAPGAQLSERGPVLLASEHDTLAWQRA